MRAPAQRVDPAGAGGGAQNERQALRASHLARPLPQGFRNKVLPHYQHLAHLPGGKLSGGVAVTPERVGRETPELLVVPWEVRMESHHSP